MRKTLLSALIMASFSVTANAVYVQDTYFLIGTEKKDFCNALKNYSEKIYTPDVCNARGDDFVVEQMLYGKMEEESNKMYGELTQNLLREKGISEEIISKNFKWKRLISAYNKLVCSLNKEEKEELLTFLTQTAFKVKEDEKGSKGFISTGTIAWLDSYKNLKIDSMRFISYFTKDYFSKKIINPFFENLLLEDFSKVKNYVLEQNKKVGYSEVMDDLRQSCSNDKSLMESYVDITSRGKKGSEPISPN